MTRLVSSSPVLLPSPYRIALAQPEHLPVVADLELRAGARFQGPAYADISDDTVPLTDFVSALLGGHWWMALADGVPVGFALVKMLTPEHPHLEEIDVVPEHGGRGLGSALLRTVQSWAARSGYRELSLTTFRDVPWNAPFYARRGFEEIPAEEMTPELRAVVAREAARGLPSERRLAMRYRTRSSGWRDSIP